HRTGQTESRNSANSRGAEPRTGGKRRAARAGERAANLPREARMGPSAIREGHGQIACQEGVVTADKQLYSDASAAPMLIAWKEKQTKSACWAMRSPL